VRRKEDFGIGDDLCAVEGTFVGHSGLKLVMAGGKCGENLDCTCGR